MDVINDNEVQFLASLQHGSRIIHSTLRKQDCRKTGFPGEETSEQNQHRVA